MSDDVAGQVRPHLDEIADRLWSGNATVMVGAGFSRNAKPVDFTSAPIPSWHELGDIFFQKLYGRSPGEGDRYLNLLKLAEQVQAAFGRPALDELLRRSIPNLGYEPSPIHSQLLDLPWKDVFTTNYDTLLERARASIPLKHYDVVAANEDLLYANQPRIVKLHGSFPSPPFIISEEDYRRYPSENAPFVNTVRQSLIENTLCLIGFSGDDPNFLQWIGWIRDHLGKDNAPKIYMVGVFDKLTEAERRLFDDRGIIAVNLAVFSMDHGEALIAFLDYLKNRESHAIDWPIVSADARSWAMNPDHERYAEIAKEWRRQRSEYPGWVVVPEDRRRILWQHTENWFVHFSQVSPEDRRDIGSPLDLEIVFELAWRLDRCIFPLTSEIAAFLDEVVTKYTDATVLPPENTNWDSTSMNEAVISIQLWLLRHYREEGLEEKWENVRLAVERNLSEVLPEHRVRFRLERALQALFRLDPSEAKQLLINWESSETIPFWEAKRAALMAELGETSVAHSILESSLADIRQQLSLKPVIEDYSLLSQESVVMLLLWAVEQGRFRRERGLDNNNLLGKLWEDRLSELSRYKCDPQREISSLSARLRHRSEGRRLESKTHGFDLGMVSRTFHFGPDEEVIAAYSLLRLYEDIGMPYRMEHSTFVKEPVESTLVRMRHFSPHWALVNIVRLGDARATDELFDREYLAGLKRDEVDTLFEIYLPALERTIAKVSESDWSDDTTYGLLAQTLPEVFSRLCCKCSAQYRKHLIGVLSAIYGSRRRGVFKGISHLTERLIGSMSVDELAYAVPLLIEFPVPDHLEEIEKGEFFNPLLAVGESALLRGDVLSVTVEKIDGLLNQYAKVRHGNDWVATTLLWLHSRDKLNEQQSKLLGKLLWNTVKDTGVPKVTGFFSFACTSLPHPAKIDPGARVKAHLRTLIEERMEDSRFDDALDELHNSSGAVEWSRAEAMELVEILSGWWNRNQHLLTQDMPTPFGSPAENTKTTASKIVSALSALLSHLPTDHNHELGVKSLREFLASMEEHHIPARRLEAAALGIEGMTCEKVLERVTTAMFDDDHDVVFDALSAAWFLARLIAASDEPHFKFEPVGTMLVQGVVWRHRPALSYRLRIITDLIKNQSWFLSPEALKDLLAGIRGIAIDSSSGIKNNDQDGIISIRASAAALAFTLYEYLQESESHEHEVIRTWREICGDSNEFSEVRNSWKVVSS